MVCVSLILAAMLSWYPHILQYVEHPESLLQGGQTASRIGNSERYYYSPDKLDYNAAVKFCRDRYGENYGLATITSEEDRLALLSFIKAHDQTFSMVWIGGSWSVRTKQFFWTNLVNEKKEPLLLENSIRNIVNYDLDSIYNFNDRTSYSHIHNLILVRRSTSKGPFVCEFRRDRVPPPCQAESDIAVLLDSSAHIGFNDYQLAKKNAAELIAAFADTHGSQQLGLIFSDDVQISVPLAFTGTPLQKYYMMKQSPYLKGVTNTGKAIGIATDELEKGYRKVPQAMVVITDGSSTDSNVLRETVAFAKAAKINMFAVGVGSNVNRKELQFIADPHQVFYAQDWDSLKGTLQVVAQYMCPCAMSTFENL